MYTVKCMSDGHDIFRRTYFCIQAIRCYPSDEFVDALAVLRKTTVSFVISVHPSVHPSTPTGRIFIKFDISVFLEKLSRNFKFHSKRKKITSTLHEDP